MFYFYRENFIIEVYDKGFSIGNGGNKINLGGFKMFIVVFFVILLFVMLIFLIFVGIVFYLKRKKRKGKLFLSKVFCR